LDFEPSVHATIAALVAAFCAAAVALASTPPCPEQAPRPVAEEVEPSVHTEPPAACAVAWAEIVQRAARDAEARKKRTRMGMLLMRGRESEGGGEGPVRHIAYHIVPPPAACATTLPSKQIFARSCTELADAPRARKGGSKYRATREGLAGSWGEEGDEGDEGCVAFVVLAS
jgi:hypothetical protein